MLSALCIWANVRRRKRKDIDANALQGAAVTSLLLLGAYALTFYPLHHARRQTNTPLGPKGQ